MKQILKIYLCLLALLSASAYFGTTQPKVFIRSQSEDSARELVGWTHQVNLFDVGGNYGTFAITPEYTHSFKSEKIARILFGNALGVDCDNDCADATFYVSGSRVANRGSNDLLADYFGLPTDFESTIVLKPRIQNFLVDFDLYLGLDEYLCGLWFRIHAPVVWTRWNLNLTEAVTASGVNGYDAGYFAPTAVTRSNLLNSFSEFLSGQAPDLGDTVTYQPLAHELVSCGNSVTTATGLCDSCHSSRGVDTTKVSDVQFALGYNFWQDEDYHVGLGLRVHVPTGTRINSNQLFAPQIGNGHHWEVGGMFTSHYTFWRNADDTKSLGFYLDANVTHMFETRQCRTFDLCGRGDNSKYMLAEQMTNTITHLLRGNTQPFSPAPTLTYTPATYQFNNVFTPVANIAFAQVKVSVPVQADVTFLLNYTHCNFSWDFGYNFWGTSCERIRKCNDSNIIPANTYALKGDAAVYGFQNPATQANRPIALSATESLATIYSGTNFVSGFTTTQAKANPNIDHPQYAYGDVNDTTVQGLFIDPTIAPPSADNPQIQTSIQPVLLGDGNLDFAGARRKGITNKIFTHFSYTWAHCDRMPYLGIGGKVEFANTDDNNCSTDCGTAACAEICAPVSTTSCALACSSDCGSSCRNSAISEWGIWLKGGFQF